MTQDELKKAVALEAIQYVPMGGIIGVGTGSTANFFIEELGRVVDSGTTGRVFDLQDLEEGERVEIFVE